MKQSKAEILRFAQNTPFPGVLAFEASPSIIQTNTPVTVATSQGAAPDAFIIRAIIVCADC